MGGLEFGVGGGDIGVTIKVDNLDISGIGQEEKVVAGHNRAGELQEVGGRESEKAELPAIELVIIFEYF